jgi:DNA polymerase-3 subunit delta'
MSFKDFPKQAAGVQLLQRSMERGRLAHGYLFSGDQLEELEGLARTLAKTLNCLQPVRTMAGGLQDCCGGCLSCRKIEHGNHADVHWLRPESKSRVIMVDQVRELMRQIQLKPTEAGYKLGILVAADRLRAEGANAFLKTLEEPPPKCVLILLSTEPQRLLETIVSRCLRLNFAGEGAPVLAPDQLEWLRSFSEMAAARPKSMLERYRLLDVLLKKLNELKAGIEGALGARSPLEQYKDAEKEMREKWEDELAAAVEAEYRRQRGALLVILQWWLRDVWLQTLSSQPGAVQEIANPAQAISSSADLMYFPQVAGTQQVARRLTPLLAMENLALLEQLQRRLHTNVQEALALEVGLLKLHL